MGEVATSRDLWTWATIMGALVGYREYVVGRNDSGSATWDFVYRGEVLVVVGFVRGGGR